MGVVFQPYVPLTDYVHIGYRMEHMMRCLLLRPLMKEEEYRAFLEKGMAYDDEGAEVIMEKILGDLDGEASDDVILGIKAFVDHSDCDGDFGEESCEYIYKAFDWALKVYENVPNLKANTDPVFFETMEHLRDLFKQAFDGNGIMMLY